MEQIPHNGVALVDEKLLNWRWRQYFINKDNQLQSSAVWTPTAGLADGAVSFTTVDVVGAGLGDCVLADHDKIGANSVLISAFVQEADLVRVVLMNKTGAPLSIPEGTVYVTVFRRQ